MKRKLFAVVLCIVFLIGCWDRRELNDLGIVQAVGFDKDSMTGDIIMTCQIIRPGALKQEGGGKKNPVENISTTGKTVYEAIRNISMQFDRRAFYGHNKVVVINEQLAREGVLRFIDLFARNREVRPLSWLIIAKDTRAQDILEVKHGIEELQAAYLEGIIKKGSVNSKVSTVHVLEFIKGVLSSEIDPIAGVMEIMEQPVFAAEKKEKDITEKGIKLLGTAVFKRDKLVGYLDDIETRGLNWVTGKVKTGIITVSSPTEKHKFISIVIGRADASIKPEIIDGKISFTIEVKEEGDIGEQANTADISKLEIFRKIEKMQKDAIEMEIKMAVDKAQKEFRSDILGFGSAFSKKYPKEWNEIKGKWESIFPEVQYSIEVDAKLRKTGLITKPLKRSE